MEDETAHSETPHSELTRLLKAQSKARENEVYGGLSRAERGEYDATARRIHDLDAQLQLIADTENSD